MIHRRMIANCILFACLFAPLTLHAQEPTRTRDIVYGRKFGMALTMDILTPKEKNGAAVIVMVSGGFTSDMNMVDGGWLAPPLYKPLLDRGYTVLLVCHGSQPKYLVNEIVGDIHRAVRFIRTHAKDHGIDPQRLGIMGISSGGYLSLSMGVGGTPGDPAAKDPVDRASSAVQAVACFCPPTDLVNYGQPGRSMMEFEPVRFVWHTFGVEGKPKEEQNVVLRALSPIEHVSKVSAPTLIIHGDADELVPYEQSERFIAKLKQNGIDSNLIRREKAGHGWATMGEDVALLADWFDTHLKPTTPLGTVDAPSTRPAVRIAAPETEPAQ